MKTKTNNILLWFMAGQLTRSAAYVCDRTAKLIFLGLMFILPALLTLMSPAPALASELYRDNVFERMPHTKILQLQRQECKDRGVATGSPAVADNCMKSVDRAFELLAKASKTKEIPDTTWRLCVGQAQTEFSYDYPVLARCVKAAYFICAMRPDGEYQDKGQCIRVISSGAWVQHPKAK